VAATGAREPVWLEVAQVVENGIGSGEYHAEAGESNELEITSLARTMTITDAGSLMLADPAARR
jgi:hypothetical protein